MQPIEMANALEPLLDTGTLEHERAVAELAALRAKLGTPGAAVRVAEMARAMAA